jgi:lipid A 3-O-deacylase
MLLRAWCVMVSIGSLCAAQHQPPADTAEAISEPERGPGRLKISLIGENDSSYFAFFDTSDANYSSGVRADVAWTPEFADRWGAALPLSGQFRDMRSAAGIAVGQDLYTPGAISDPDPQPDEHPWGAWLYAGFYLQRADDARLDTLELDLGVTGEWAAGEATQQEIHRHTDSPQPKGWDNQNDEEVGANLVLQRTWRLGVGDRSGWRAELLPYAGATLGTVNINASAGVTGRTGVNMADDFGMARVDWLGDQTSLSKDGLGVYIFGRLGGRAVAHDLFLEGSLFQDGPSVDAEPLVGEAQLGISLRITRYFDAYYAQTWWTDEFEGQGKGQHFGMWGLRLQFEY